MHIINYTILFFLIMPLYAEVDYNSEIQPIFDNSCITCHINGGAYFGGLDLSSYSEVMEGGDSGNTIVPFDSENSLLWQHVNSSYMPPYGSGNTPLTTNQIDLIAQWIDEGAFFESEEDQIEGRWHLVGYEDAIMYQFVDTEPFADAGLRYSIYVDENGEFDDLDGDNIGGTPHPYSVVEDIITIDTHFGNILSYQMNFRCDGQVVEFIDIDYNAIHSTLFKEGFDYFNSDCEQVLEECFDFTNIDFGDCQMLLGVGLLNDECSYISGCDWTIGGIDYSDLFFDSIGECQEVCSGNNDCFITSDDILGPYYFEDAPFRSVIAHADEPGQRLFISGNVMQNDCGNSISGSLIEIWQANDEGCYGIVEDCETGNPENDYFNLRGKFFSDENGDYTFESILPGYYGSRPRHLHIKITTPNGEELVSQLYFENDPYCENDQWCQDADDRIIPLIEDEYGLNGEIDLIMNSTENGISLGDINFDNLLNVQDIVLLVGIILNNSIPNDFQIYSGDINNDNNIDILDIVQLVAIILN